MARKPNPTGTIAIVVVAALIVVGTFFLKKRGSEGETEKSVPNPPATLSSNRIAVTQMPQHLTPHDALLAVLADLTSEGDAMVREEKLDAWINDVGYGDIPELIELFRKEPASKLTREIKLRLIRKLAGNDPRAAAQLVAQ